MAVLVRGESTVSDLVASLSVSQSAVSQQLAILKSAGLVGERSEGRFRLYRLETAPLVEIDIWLNRYRAHMERQLDALGHLLDEIPDEPKPPRVRRKKGKKA